MLLKNLFRYLMYSCVYIYDLESNLLFYCTVYQIYDIKTMVPFSDSTKDTQVTSLRFFLSLSLSNITTASLSSFYVTRF